MTIVRTSLAIIPLAAILLSAGCATTQPAAQGTQPSASAGTTGPSGSPVASPVASPQTPAGILPPVPYAAITALTAESVSWVDAKLVPATVNNVKIERLEGAAHKHSAPLSPDVKFFLPQNSQGTFQLDPDGAGTAPVDRAAFTEFAVGQDIVAPRLTFDAQGRVATLAAHYHP